MVIQPPSGKSDQWFKGTQTIYAGSIYHNRSGNERTVHVSKLSGLMIYGFRQGVSEKQSNQAWRT